MHRNKNWCGYIYSTFMKIFLLEVLGDDDVVLAFV